MNIWDIIKKEIRYYRSNFIIGLLSVTMAVTCFVGASTLLDLHDMRTEEVIMQKEAQTREEMSQMVDDYRLITRDMGYNVMILHEDQDLTALRFQQSPDTYMPLDYAYQLAQGGVPSLNHLLPVLQEVIYWPERDIEVMVIGVMGQVPNLAKAGFLTEDLKEYLDPMMETIHPGKLELGYDIADVLGINVGDTVILKGEEFTVNRIYPRKSNQDDLILWFNLEHVQAWTGVEDKINAIFALQCLCAIPGWRGGMVPEDFNFDTLKEIQFLATVEQQINDVLPDVKILESSSIMIARAETRVRAALARQTALEAELEYRAKLRDERETLVSILVPLVLLASIVWIFFLIMGNVKQRRGEIGIMRAVGIRGRTIAAIFLIKVVFMGIFGGLIGYLTGMIVGAMISDVSIGLEELERLFDLRLFVFVMVLSPVMAAVAGILPAMCAAQQDPAMVLREE